MSRIAKKCFVASATLHGVLLGVLLLATAFFSSDKSNEPGPVVTMIAGPTAAAGNPSAAQPPAPAKVEPPPAPPHPPDPPKHVDPPKVVEHKSDAPTETVKGNGPLALKPKQKEKEPAKLKPAPQLTKSMPTNHLVRPVDTRAIQLAQARAQELREAQLRADRADREAREAQTRALNQLAGALTGTASGLAKAGSVATGVTDGMGGSAAAGEYGDGLKAIYDANWVLNSDSYNDETAASVSVLVRRDGSVVSATVTRPSGNAAFDRSVRAVLNKVIRVHAFPSEMKGSEQEFTWKFVRKTRLG